LSEWFARGAVDGCGGQCSEAGPEFVEMCALVEVGCVVEDDSFETFNVSGELVQLGEALRALVLHAVFEVDDPASLHLDRCWREAFLESVAG
jgi:hypothetical protein